MLPKSPGIDPVEQPYIDRFEVPPKEKVRAQRLLSFVGNRKFENLLDIGCGSGYILHAFNNIAENIYGLDVNPEAVAYIKKVFPRGQFVTCDLKLQRLDRDYLMNTFGTDKFDLVLFTDVLLYLDGRDSDVIPRLMTDIFALLTEEGLMLVSKHAPRNVHDRTVERNYYEDGGFWLLREEILEKGTMWVLQVWCRFPPLTNLPINIHTGDVELHYTGNVEFH